MGMKREAGSGGGVHRAPHDIPSALRCWEPRGGMGRGHARDTCSHLFLKGLWRVTEANWENSLPVQRGGGYFGAEP